MNGIAQLAFVFPINATFEEVSSAIALHFGGARVDLSTGEVLRDPQAVFTGTVLNKEQFTGTAALSVSTGGDVNTAVPTLELDIHGLPWDERIHSSAKTKNADGSWRGKKGVSPTIITAVKAELLSKVKGGAAVNGKPADVLPAEQQNLNNADDAARAARLAYAHEQAVIAFGPKPDTLLQEQFEALKRGQTGITVHPAGLEWFTRYQQAFNNAYQEYANNTLKATEAQMPKQDIAPPVETAQPAAAAAPVVDFPGFCAKFGAHLASPVMAEICTTLGVAGGFAGLSSMPAMIPAVVALLASKGIV
jgi:hypothetical protein